MMSSRLHVGLRMTAGEARRETRRRETSDPGCRLGSSNMIKVLTNEKERTLMISMYSQKTMSGSHDIGLGEAIQQLHDKRVTNTKDCLFIKQ